MSDVIERGLADRYEHMDLMTFPPGMPKEYFESHLKRENGLRGLEMQIGPFNLLNLLAECLKNKDLKDLTDAFFQSYSQDVTIIPTDLYLCGFGQYLNQSLKDIPKCLLNLCKHLTFVDRPHFNTDCKVFIPVDKFKHFVYNPDKMVQPRRKDIPEKDFYNPENYLDSDVLLTHLATAYTCNIKSRYYEAWLYALSALDLKRMVPLENLRSATYYQLAISSAHLALSPKITWLSLAEAIRVQCHPTQKWEWICSCLQVLVAFGLFEREEKLFRIGLNEIPDSSSWYQVLIFHHCRGLQYQIEDDLIRGTLLDNMTPDMLDCGESRVIQKKWILELSYYCERLKERGFENYFKGYCHLYRYMLSCSEDGMKKHLKLADDRFNEASREMELDEILREEIEVILVFLIHCVSTFAEVSDHFYHLTRTRQSKSTSDCLVRMALLVMYSRRDFVPKHLDLQDIVDKAEYEYNRVTQGRGYRCPMLWYLKRFVKPHEINLFEIRRIMEKIDEAPNFWLQDIDIVEGSKEPSAQEFAEENIFAQSAYMTGWFTATNYQI